MKLGRGWMMKVNNTIIRRSGCPLPDNEFGIIERIGNLTDNQKQIISAMKHTLKISAVKLSEIVGISKRKIEENVTKLKKLGVIDRVAGTRGYWEVRV